MATYDSKSIQTLDTLVALRMLGAPPEMSEVSARRATERQAAYMRRLLIKSAKSIPDRLIELIPNLDITYANDFLGHGFSFWDDDTRRWCIYLRSRDTGYRQTFMMLCEIKYIIDEPLRETSGEPDKHTWARLAEHFARQVLGHEYDKRQVL